jgi:four helix bundle protein
VGAIGWGSRDGQSGGWGWARVLQLSLKIYPIVLELVRRLSPYLPALRARRATLGDQLERALISIPLNLAEGAYSRGKNRHARYQSAAASAREALACLETAEALGWIGSLEPELGSLFNDAPWFGSRS